MAIGRPRFADRERVLRLLINFDLSVDDISSMCQISRRLIYDIARDYRFNMAKRSKVMRLREEASIIQKGLEDCARSALAKGPQELYVL